MLIRHPGNRAYIEFLEKNPEKHARVLQKIKEVTPVEDGGLVDATKPRRTKTARTEGKKELRARLKNLTLKDIAKFVDAATLAEIRDHVTLQYLPDDKVKDHCHTTGQYRGAAHACCNMQVKTSVHMRSIPIFFHNAEGYDMHYVVKAIGALSKAELGEHRLDCIPTNQQKFKTFSLGRYCIKDSYAFLGDSLDNLLKNLPNEHKVRLRKLASEPITEVERVDGVTPKVQEARFILLGQKRGGFLESRGVRLVSPVSVECRGSFISFARVLSNVARRSKSARKGLGVLV